MESQKFFKVGIYRGIKVEIGYLPYGPTLLRDLTFLLAAFGARNLARRKACSLTT